MAIIGYEDLGDGTNAVKVSIDGEAFAAALSGMEIDVSAVDIDALASAIDEALRTTPLDVSSDVTSSALPSGAATAAKQPALGTAGTPSADVLSVQGDADGTPVPVTATAGNSISTVAATIVTTGSLSGAVDLGASMMLCGYRMPAAWTTAGITLQDCDTIDGTFQDVYDEYGTEVALSALQGKSHKIRDVAMCMSLGRYLKVRSGTAASAVNQAAARTIQLITKPV